MKSLSPVSPNQPDSGDLGHGKKMHLDRRQFEYTCGIVTIAFDAWVDVTGVVWREAQSRSDRSQRSKIAGDFGGSVFQSEPSIVSANLTHDTRS